MKKREAEPDAKERATPMPAAPTPVNMQAVVLQLDGCEHELEVDYNRSQQVRYNDQCYAHVGEDAHGRWTYRRV